MSSLEDLIRADDADAVFDGFGSWAAGRGLPLYPAQEEAMLGIVSGANVVLSTPTGSGKSLVAIGAHLAALARGERSYYTAPIKALVNEKFFALVELFGAERVGLVTGDTAVNADAPIVCCTAEILAGIALRHGAEAPLGQVVMDEFHFYAEPDRGWARQVPLLTLPHAQFLLMSATLGDMTTIAGDLQRRTGRETVLVTGVERPVPLSFEYALAPVHESIDELLTTSRSPVYIVHFSQAEALERAQSLTSTRILGAEGKQAVADAIGDFRFTTAFGRILSRLLRQGIGVHHAGMLPRYRRLVEQLAQDGHLRVICGTDTLGVGINVPIRTVLITALVKFDGTRMRRLTAREFHQVAGRAGRAGYDTMGTVVVQAPEHEIENARRVAKAGDDPKRLARVQRVKPPEGAVSWSRATFDKLVAAEPEALTSRMRITHAMVLAVLARGGDAVATLRELIEGSHEPRRAQLRLARRALQIGRTLLDAGIVERVVGEDSAGMDGAVRFRLTVDLQGDFALDQPLSPFAVEVIEAFDPEAPEYALDVVSVIEATLDDPRPILSQQEFAARGEAVAAMKQEGIPYEERMTLLEEITWPRPLEEILEPMLATYRASRPWAEEFELSPKSVVRDCWERAMDFAQFVRHYGLVRSEGLVLRYLTDAYRALRRTVPEERKTEPLRDVIDWLGALVAGVDSSLLDEWQAATGESAAPARPDRRAVRVLARNALFRRVQLAALRRWNELGELEGEDEDGVWDAAAWRDALEPYFDEHEDIGTGPDARGPGMLVLDESRDPWTARQILDDPAGDRDWGFDAEIDVAASEEAGRAVLRITGVGRL